MSTVPAGEKWSSPKVLIPIVISVFALGVSAYSFLWNSVFPGELVVHEPASFCIVRGNASDAHPSDHIVLPIWIENNGSGAKVFAQPILTLTEESNKRPPVQFEAAGIVHNLTYQELGTAYDLEYSWAVPEKSVVQYKVLFHIENWWDRTQPEYSEFRFMSGEIWNATLHYRYRGLPTTWDNGSSRTFVTIPIYGTIDRLSLNGTYDSDCFPRYD